MKTGREDLQIGKDSRKKEQGKREGDGAVDEEKDGKGMSKKVHVHLSRQRFSRIEWPPLHNAATLTLCATFEVWRHLLWRTTYHRDVHRHHRRHGMIDSVTE